jgi:hypothetical protein
MSAPIIGACDVARGRSDGSADQRDAVRLLTGLDDCTQRVIVRGDGVGVELIARQGRLREDDELGLSGTDDAGVLDAFAPTSLAEHAGWAAAIVSGARTAARFTRKWRARVVAHARRGSP